MWMMRKVERKREDKTDGTEEDTKEMEVAEKKWKERGKLHEGDRGKWSFKDRVRIKREEE